MLKRICTLVLIAISTLSSLRLDAQRLDVSSCPQIDKRNNGNGSYAQAAGDFRPTYTQNVPVATNVVGTPYQKVPFNPTTKTGDIVFKWPSSIVINNLPVITRVWITPTGSNTAVLSPIKVGPPPVPYMSGGFAWAKYNFYVQNMANAGRVTLEFTDPQTGQVAFVCTYDLKTGLTATAPTGIDCSPTITNQPLNVTKACGDNSNASFSAQANGYATVNWQKLIGSTWTDIVVGTDYTITTNSGTTSFTISNPLSHDGENYRVVFVGGTGPNGSCGNTISNTVLLSAKAKPTANFSVASYCGTGTRSIPVNLTGTGPWTLVYSKSGSANVTVNNITSSPYIINEAINAQTSYGIVSVTDQFCSNTSNTGTITSTVYPSPSVTPSNATICYGTNTASVTYTSTNSPDKYSISSGTRAMSGFVAINNATLGSSPISVAIPANTPAGVYDFFIQVKNSVSGCTSELMPFTITVTEKPTVTASSTNTTICVGNSVTISASGANTYNWTSSPVGFTSTAASNTVSPSVTTTFTVTGTTNGCTGTASVTVTVNPLPTVSATTANATLISGKSTTLTASGNGISYSWSDGSSTIGNGASIIVSPTVTTTYTVTSYTAAGCSKTASVTVTVTTSPPLSSSASTACLGNAVTLTATPSSNALTSYVWKDNTGVTVGTSSSTSVTPTGTMTYTVYASDAAGSMTVSSTITVTPTSNNIVSSSSSKIVVCSNDLVVGNKNVTLDFTTSTSQNFTWRTPGSGTVNKNTTNDASLTISNFRLADLGQYTIEYSISSCNFSKTFNVVDVASADAIIASSDQTICINNTPVQLTASAGNSGTAGTTFQYLWESSTVNATSGFTTISGTNSSTTYYPGSLSVNTWYRMKMTTNSANCPGPYYSNAVAITVNPDIASASNTIIAQDAYAPNTTISGTTPTGGSGTYSYTWDYSTNNGTTFIPIPSQTGINFSNIPIPTTTTLYRRNVSSGSCNASSATVSIYPPLANISISNGQNICVGATVNALSIAPTGGNGSYTYQWQKSGSINGSYIDIVGATSSSYTPSASAGTWYYKVKVTSGTCTQESNIATLSISALPSVSITPSSATICAGNSVTLTATGANSYSWTPTTGLSTSNANIVVASPNSSTTYIVTGTDVNGCSATASATVTVNATPNTPSLTATNTTICSNATFDLNTLGTAEWFIAPETNVAYGVSSTTISTAGTYYAFAKSGTCYSGNYASFTLNTVDVSKPVVASINLTNCSNVDLTIVQPFAKQGVTYEWHTVASSPSGANIVATPTSVGSGQYYLYAKSTVASCYGPSSDMVTVTVVSTSSATTSGTSYTICAPNTFDLTTINNTTGSNSYTWYTQSTPDINKVVATPKAIASSGTFYLAPYTSNCLGTVSPGVTVTVNTNPVITISNPAVVCAGGTVSMTVSITNTIANPTYVWETSADGLTWTTITNNTVYSGATTATLNILNVTGLDGNFYRSTVSNSTCSTTSDARMLTVELTPTISTQPTDVTTTPGKDVSFTANLTNAQTSTIQWMVSTDGGSTFSALQNNTVYSGVNTGTLSITAVTSAMSNYQYKCSIVNLCASINTNVVLLVVEFNGNPDFNATNVNVPVNGSVSTNDVVKTGSTYGTPNPVATNPTGATITMNPDGTYTFNSTKPGEYVYYVPVCTAGQTTGCPLIQLTINVLDPNVNTNPPVANTDISSVPFNKPITLNILSNDKPGNVGGLLNPKSITIVNNPTNGTVSVDSLGKLTYTPNNGFIGPDSLVYSVCDNSTPTPLCNTAVVYLDVHDSPPVTTASDDFATSKGLNITGNVLLNDRNTGVLTATDTLKVTAYTKPDSTKGTIVINPDGTYVFKPVPGFVGPVDVPYTACAGTPETCAKATLHITIDSAVQKIPTIINDNNASIVNKPITGNINTNDVVQPGTTYGVPTGNANNPTSATLTLNLDGTYNFVASKPGDYIYSIPVCPAGQTTACPISILTITVIDPSPALVAPLAADDNETTKKNTPIGINILGNDIALTIGSKIDSTSVTITQQPKNGSVIINPDGTLKYTPNNDYVGVDSLIYNVCDNSIPKQCNTAVVYITIQDVPVVTANDDYNKSGGEAISGNIILNDIYSGKFSTTDSLKITNYISPDSTKGTIKLNPDGSYIFIPKTGFEGVVDVPYTVCGGTPMSCSMATLHIIVTPVPQTIPNQVPDINSTNVNVPVKGNLATNDLVNTGSTYGTPIPDPSNPIGANINVNPDGTYSFTSPKPGKYIFQVPVCDLNQTTGCPLVPLEITVLDPNSTANKPVANNDVYTVKYNTPIVSSVLANDKSGNLNIALNPSSLSVTTAPKNGTAIVNPDGTIKYTPNNGFTGVDSLVYNICDSAKPVNCENATVYYNVLNSAKPDVTIASDDFNKTLLNTPISGTIITNDIYSGILSKTDSLLIVNFTQVDATKGTINVKSDGSYTYIPKSGFTGNVQVPYTVCAGTPKACAMATLYIIVDSVKIDDRFNPDINATYINSPIKGKLGTNDIVGAPAVYSQPADNPLNPKGATLVVSLDGTYTFTAVLPGKYIYYVPTCSSGETTGCPLVPLEITVTDLNLSNNIPAINYDIATTKVNTPIKVNILANDKSSNLGGVLVPSSVSIAVNPKNGNITINPDGTIVYTPKPGFVGKDTLTYNVCDNAVPANCNNAQVFLTVLPLQSVPTISASDDYNWGYAGNTLNGNILLNDRHLLDSTIKVTSFTSLSNSVGVLTINADGTYQFKPANGFVGNVDVPYTVCGGSPSICTMATLHLLIEPLIPTKFIDIKKVVNNVKMNLDGSFNIDFTIKVQNLTNEYIDSVSVKDDLSTVFTDTKGVNVSSLSTSGKLVKNSNYNGLSNVEMLNIQSALDPGKVDSIKLIVNLAEAISGTFLNTATASAPTSYGIITSTSTDPNRITTDTTKRLPTLFVIPKIDIRIPPTFSPNNDGLNDTWVIVRPYGMKVAVRVFNRWGNEVYREDDYKNDWKGRGVSNFAGNDVPEGTYYYIVEASELNSNNVLKFAGPLTIVR